MPATSTFSEMRSTIARRRDNISRLTRGAVAAELDRRAKLAELEAYLQELESELGPVPAAERAATEAWADEVLGNRGTRRSA